MLEAQRLENSGGIAEIVDDLVANEGTGASAYVASGKLISGPQSRANLADAAHYLCLLHGDHPGMIDAALETNVVPAGRAWLAEAAEGFSNEREFLARLVATVGSMPSTVGHAQCEAAVLAQRHALDMLAVSERRGCAFGAAVALTLDWRTIRAILDIAGERLDITPMRCTLPDLQETATVLMSIAQDEPIKRAIDFGARQLLMQHRGLWDLLGVREASRAD